MIAQEMTQEVSEQNVELEPTITPGDQATEYSDVKPSSDAVADASATPAVVDIKPLSQLERELLDKITELEAECDAAEEEMVDAQIEAKYLKKEWESKVEALRRCIRNGVSKQPLLPGMAEQPVDAEQPQHSVEESWKPVPIRDVLTLTDKQADKLEEAGVKTAGEFEFLRGGNRIEYPDGLRSIKGVGEATAEKWENEMLAWIKEQTPIS